MSFLFCNASYQSGTSYFHYWPRLVWDVRARLVWDLIFSLLPQNRCLIYSVIKLKFCTDTHQTNLITLTNCHCDICPDNIYVLVTSVNTSNISAVTNMILILTKLFVPYFLGNEFSWTIMFFGPNFCRPKFVLDPKLHKPKIFWGDKKISTSNFIGPNIFLEPKFFEILVDKTIFDQQFLWIKSSFRLKRNIGHKILFKIYCTKNMLSDTFYPKLCTNWSLLSDACYLILSMLPGTCQKLLATQCLICVARYLTLSQKLSKLLKKNVSNFQNSTC